MGLRSLTGREPLKLMTLDYTTRRQGGTEEPVIHIIARREDGSRRQLKVTGFYPHFYITLEEFVNDYETLLKDDWVRWYEIPEEARNSVENVDLKRFEKIRVADEDEEIRTLHDDPLVKVFTEIPKDVGDYREEYERTWEADVLFPQRFLISSGIKTGFSAPRGENEVHWEELKPLDEDQTPDVKPRVLTLDIEVKTDGSMPDTTETEQPVTAISAHDSYDDEYAAWVLTDGDWTLNGLFEDIDSVFDMDDMQLRREMEAHLEESALPENIDECDIRVFDREDLMLDDFHNWVIPKRPDIVTGWNAASNDRSNGFDMPYLINRSFEVNAWDMQDWVPYENGNCFVTRAGSPVLDGIELMDMMQAYEKTQIHDLRSYSLDFVANKELDYGKEEMPDIDWAWKNNTEQFVRYNIRDTEAVIGIKDAQEIIDMYDHLRSVTGQLYSECNHNISMVDMLFLRSALDNNTALPTSKKPDVRHYHGAKVFDPIPGKHHNVFYPDLASLYPNLFYATNMSPETIVGTKEDLEDSEWTEDDCFVVVYDPRDEEVKKESEDVVEEELYVLKPEYKEGFVRESIGDLIDMKYEYKGTSKYEAVKRITNSCFSADTEVMTPNGVQNIRDIEVGDAVYSLNPDTHQMEVKKVTECISKPEYEDELVTIQNATIDLKVTPDHRIYTRRVRHSDEFEVVDAGDLNDWTQYELPSAENVSPLQGDRVERVDILDYYSGEYEEVEESGQVFVRKNHYSSKIPRYFDGDDFMKLVGWYASEGYSRKTNENSGHQSVFCQKKPDGRKEIAELLEGCGLRFSSNKNGHIISNEIFRKIMDNACGIGAEEKRLPEVVFDASVEQRELLFETLEKGDGDSDPERKRYSTKSKTLRDQVAQLATSLGMDVQYRYDDGGDLNTGVWRLHYGEKNKSFRMKRSGDRKGDGGTEQAKNGVYCVQVEDNHTLVAGRNGKFSHVPQCYGVMGDSDTYGRGFRLFDNRIAEAITLAGRDVLEFTAEQMRDYMHDCSYDDATLIGGDTDSAMLSIPSMDVEPYVLEAAARGYDEHPIFEAAEFVNKNYDEFMHERFNICKEDGYDHRMEVEIESYAPSCFFKRNFDIKSKEIGTKKKYSQLLKWDEDDGVITNPDPDHTGWKAIRSDSASITAISQLQTLNLILESDDAKEAVFDYLESIVSAMKEGDLEGVSEAVGQEITLDEIGVPCAIKSKPLNKYGGCPESQWRECEKGSYDWHEEGGWKTHGSVASPHVRGAKYANQNFNNVDIQQGDKPLKIYIKSIDGFEYPRSYTAETPEDGRVVDALAVNNGRDLPEEFNVDWPKMLEKTIENAIREIVETMGWSWEDIEQHGRQTGLHNFM